MTDPLKEEGFDGPESRFSEEEESRPDVLPERDEAEEAPVTAIRIALAAIILLIGIGGMVGLATMKKPPAERPAEEVAIPVEAVVAQPEDIRVTIVGHGAARNVGQVQIVPEVAGNVVEINESLEVGDTVEKGETLFVIDPRTYQAGVEQAAAQVAQLRASLRAMRTRMKADKERLATLERTRELSKAEYERRKALLEEDEVGSRSIVEQAEQAYNQAVDAVDQMEKALDLYPTQIQELESSIQAAEAGLQTAEVNLERTRVTAPFDARIEMKNVDIGQYVAPGSPVLALANDAVLEVSVPIDSREARRWLRFDGEAAREGEAWFTGLEPVECTIRWTEDERGYAWKGVLARVEQFNPLSRMLYVAVRVPGENAVSNEGQALPLVDGMFCKVEIPGRMLENVVRLPHWAVSFEETVYAATPAPEAADKKGADEAAERGGTSLLPGWLTEWWSGRETGTESDEEAEAAARGELCRLETRPVEVVYQEGDFKYVADGLDAGELVAITRLMNPLEGALLLVETTTLEESDARKSQGNLI